MLDALPFESLSERGGADDELERVIAALQAAFDDPTISRDEVQRLKAMAERTAWAIRRRRDADALRRMQHDLDARTEEIRRLTSQLAKNRETVRSTLSAARAGLWECRLADERLTWTDGVYDLFGFPKGGRLHRNDTLDRYARPSLRVLDAARAKSIRTGEGFRLDAEIESAKGQRRWIRLSCAVERRDGVAVRLYGMKQDVTEEKLSAERAMLLAETDSLTSLANRRLFDQRLAALSERSGATLILIDLDGFKRINDTLGHLAGDACLEAAATRLRLVGRDASLAARIGGDEFALLYDAGLDREGAENRAWRAVEALRIPVERDGVLLELGASAGLARADGSPPQSWMARADRALYAAKAAGRGTVRVFEPGMEGPGAAQRRDLRPLDRHATHGADIHHQSEHRRASAAS